MHATVETLRRAAGTRLRGHSDSPDLDAIRLLEHALGVGHSWLLIHAHERVDDAVRARFDTLLARRAAGEPLAYITGHIGFWTLDLAVTPAVLIPRPDTETLVEAVLEHHDAQRRDVLDLGTGSGAIALALASERNDWRLVATDASAAALACAEANATRLGIETVVFARGPWYGAIGDQRFDIIVSNPPYVAPGDRHLAAPELGHEPEAALVAADNGLADLAKIVAGARDHLNPGGALYLEHGADQGAAVRGLLGGWANVKTIRDLGGNERVTCARL
ncbi:protein methyltransferase [Salinisphaera sp. S4-8]|uniref:peptide chain release factor N(5)-glutamine methyltransferase n=1 Tax=Salinisphaera sp. S4-8 TaxID=633357 RepID=UPI00333EED83